MARVKMVGASEFKVDYVPIEEVVRWPRNPKKHDLNVLEQSIRRFGFVQPIVVDQSTKKLVAGHGRLEALVRMKEQGGIPPGRIRVDGRTGGWLVPVLRGVQFSNEREAEAYLVADNRIVELGGWDDSLLVDMLREMQAVEVDLSGTGFSAESIVEMISAMGGDKEVVEDEGPGELSEEPVMKPGDLWELGAHRLICGDSTDPNVVERLMQGERADMVYTDPPYGMRLDTNFKRTDRPQGYSYPRVIGDDEDFNPEFLLSVFHDSREFFIWGADYFHRFLPEGGSFVVWDKRNDELESAVGNDFELCWSRNKHARLVFRHLWSGYTAREQSETRVHPTQKPIKLASWFFEHWGKSGDTVADLYAGSGSTLIACEQLGRKCRAVEIDPKYCDVIVNRWEKFTEKKAIKI